MHTKKFLVENALGTSIINNKSRQFILWRDTVCFVFSLALLLTYFFVTAVILFDDRQAQHGFKQVTVDGNVQPALLGLGQAFGDGQA